MLSDDCSNHLTCSQTQTSLPPLLTHQDWDIESANQDWVIFGHYWDSPPPTSSPSEPSPKTITKEEVDLYFDNEEKKHKCYNFLFSNSMRNCKKILVRIHHELILDDTLGSKDADKWLSQMKKRNKNNKGFLLEQINEANVVYQERGNCQNHFRTYLRKRLQSKEILRIVSQYTKIEDLIAFCYLSTLLEEKQDVEKNQRIGELTIQKIRNQAKSIVSQRQE